MGPHFGRVAQCASRTLRGPQNARECAERHVRGTRAECVGRGSIARAALSARAVIARSGEWAALSAHFPRTCHAMPTRCNRGSTRVGRAEPQSPGTLRVNRNSYNFIQENPFEKVVWEMVAILSRPQCVKISIIIIHAIHADNYAISSFRWSVFALFEHEKEWCDGTICDSLQFVTAARFVTTYCFNLWPGTICDQKCFNLWPALHNDFKVQVVQGKACFCVYTYNVYKMR